MLTGTVLAIIVGLMVSISDNTDDMEVLEALAGSQSTGQGFSVDSLSSTDNRPGRASHSDSSQEALIHVVQDGQTLSHISRIYYGSPGQWQRIYEANLDVVPNVNRLRPGTELVIPQ